MAADFTSLDVDTQKKMQPTLPKTLTPGTSNSAPSTSARGSFLDVFRTPQVVPVSSPHSCASSLDPQLQESIASLLAKEMSVTEALEMIKAVEYVPPTKHGNFQTAVGAIIVLNAVAMGVEADYKDQFPFALHIAEHLFTAIFVSELAARFYYEGLQVYFSEAMNWLDFFLVMSAVIDAWIVPVIGLDIDLRVMSLLRLLRLARLARLLRLFRLFKELSVITHGFVRSQRTLFWASVFLCIITYTFAVFAKLRFSDACGEPPVDVADEASTSARLLASLRRIRARGSGEEEEDAPSGGCAQPMYVFADGFPTQHDLFGTVEKSMLTLFVCFSEGCGMDIVWPMVLQSPWVMLFWYLFITVTTWGIMNIIVGIFCENILVAVAKVEQDLAMPRHETRIQKVKKIKQVFELLDTDCTGRITSKEWLTAVRECTELQELLIGLDLQDEASIFETLDADKSEELTFDEFFDGINLLLNGMEPARAKDIVATYLLCQSTSDRVVGIDRELHQVKASVAELSGKDPPLACTKTQRDTAREVEKPLSCAKTPAVPLSLVLATEGPGLPRAGSRDDQHLAANVSALRRDIAQLCSAVSAVGTRLERLEQKVDTRLADPQASLHPGAVA